MSFEIERTQKSDIAPPLCACGCGQNVFKNAACKSKWNKYIHGHNGKGIPRPDSVREKISSAQKGKYRGIRRSPNTEIKPGQRLSPNTEFKGGNKNNLGKKCSKEFRQLMVARYKSERYTAGCDYCGKPVEIIPYQINNNNHAFCSRECSSSYFSGSNNNKWKGGITPQNKLIRSSPEAIEWKKAVIKRDGYQCYMCGFKGKLHVHHILEFSRYETLRFDIDNGVTLCPECHRWCHSENVNPYVYKISEYLGMI